MIVEVGHGHVHDPDDMAIEIIEVIVQNQIVQDLQTTAMNLVINLDLSIMTIGILENLISIGIISKIACPQFHHIQLSIIEIRKLRKGQGIHPSPSPSRNLQRKYFNMRIK